MKITNFCKILIKKFSNNVRNSHLVPSSSATYNISSILVSCHRIPPYLRGCFNENKRTDIIKQLSSWTFTNRTENHMITTACSKIHNMRDLFMKKYMFYVVESWKMCFLQSFPFGTSSSLIFPALEMCSHIIAFAASCNFFCYALFIYMSLMKRHAMSPTDCILYIYVCIMLKMLLLMILLKIIL